jgi:hypothetical protein
MRSIRWPAMPIPRERRALYPPDWRAISRRIRFDRAGGLCERCRRAHGQLEFRLPPRHQVIPGMPVIPLPVRVIRIVLAACHIEHDPRRSDDADLQAWCQGCHLAHDAAHHLANRRRNERRGWALADLFIGAYAELAYPARLWEGDD